MVCVIQVCWQLALHISDISSVHHQEFFTVHTAMVYVIQVCWQQVVNKHVWHKPLLCVQWKTPDDGQGNCPKYVEFYSKNKFEKLVHLVGFIIRIYHDARSPERRKKKSCKDILFLTPVLQNIRKQILIMSTKLTCSLSHEHIKRSNINGAYNK